MAVAVKVFRGKTQLLRYYKTHYYIMFKTEVDMSIEQISALIDFLEGQPELALGRCTRSKEGRSLSKRLWHECSTILNNVSSDCVQKTAKQWRSFYSDYKHKLLKKIKEGKGEKVATGGVSSKFILTPLQKRLYSILGNDVEEPLPAVRQTHYIIEENIHSTTTPLGFEFVSDQSESNEIEVDPAESVDVVGGPSSSQITPEPRPSGPPLRRRRRNSPVTDTEETSMARATAALEAIEQMSAEATREFSQATLEHAQATRLHAQATDRLAAALEAISQALMSNVGNLMTSGKKRRRIAEPDSD